MFIVVGDRCIHKFDYRRIHSLCKLDELDEITAKNPQKCYKIATARFPAAMYNYAKTGKGAGMQRLPSLTFAAIRCVPVA